VSSSLQGGGVCMQEWLSPSLLCAAVCFLGTLSYFKCSWMQTREQSEECARNSNFPEEAYDFQRKVIGCLTTCLTGSVVCLTTKTWVQRLQQHLKGLPSVDRAAPVRPGTQQAAQTRANDAAQCLVAGLQLAHPPEAHTHTLQFGLSHAAALRKYPSCAPNRFAFVTVLRR
jgi:hypothetical protein